MTQAAENLAPQATVVEGPNDTRDAAIALVKESRREAEPAEAAEEGAAEGAEAEKPASPAPDPKAERVAKRIDIAKRAELRSAQHRAELQAKEQSLAAKEAEVEAKLARYKKLEEDPVAAFEELKLDPKTFLERLAGLQDPNSIVTKKLSSLEDELKKEREERQRIQYESQKRERLMHVQQTTRQAAEQFITHISGAAEKYPHLVDEYTPDEIVARGMRVAEQHAEAYKAKFGDYPDDEVIAQYLEDEAAQRAKAKTEWRSKLSAKKPGLGKQRDSESGQDGAGTPRTLTSRSAGQKASAPKDWDPKAADLEALRIIRKMHESSDD
jgi:DNA repair exonuclease SbcCD ATPase subunit